MIKLILLVLMAVFVSHETFAQTRTDTPSPLFGDIDGTNAGRYRSVKFSNGSTTNNGDGSLTVSTGGGGAASGWTTDSSTKTTTTYNVGISSVNPTQKLDVVGNVKATNFYVDAYGSSPQISNGLDTNTGIIFTAPDIMTFQTGGSDAMLISSTQNIGIGTASPLGLLHVNGTIIGDNNGAVNHKTFGITIDGGGSAITTGVKGYLPIPFTCVINNWNIVADASGSIVVDVWKDTYANFPPTVADTIAGSEKPTLSSAQKNQDLTLSTWTTTVTSGDVLGFNVDSATTVTRATVIIRCDN